MRLSSPEFSGSSTPPATHRSKNRRRTPFPQSTVKDDYDPEEDEYSQSYSQQEEDNDNFVEEGNDTAISDSKYDSYSEIHSSAIVAASSPPPPTYINVAPLPIFRGGRGECPVAHLSRFDRVCRANNATTVDMIARIFPVTLDGEAALWYDLTVEPDSSMPWEEIRSAFLRAYRRPDFGDRSHAELMSIRQGEDESVNAYHLRMRWILKKWPDHGIPDALLRGIFVDGLREDFQDWVVPRQPSSLEEAVRLALSWEEARSARASRRRDDVSGAKCGFCDGPHDEVTCEVRGRMRELWARSKEAGAVTKDGGEEGSAGWKEGEEGIGRVLSLRRRSQCQCWRHQCWKKLERSNSGVPDVNPTANE